MAKVRWTQKCAGGCGKILPHGSRATFAYRHYWCDSCVAERLKGLRRDRQPRRVA